MQRSKANKRKSCRMNRSRKGRGGGGRVIPLFQHPPRMEPPPRYVGQRNGARHCPSLRSAAFRALLGFPPEEPNHNPGGSPVVVLMNISAKRGPVVVHLKQTYLEPSPSLDIQPAAHL